MTMSINQLLDEKNLYIFTMYSRSDISKDLDDPMWFEDFVGSIFNSPRRIFKDLCCFLKQNELELHTVRYTKLSSDRLGLPIPDDDLRGLTDEERNKLATATQRVMSNDFAQQDIETLLPHARRYDFLEYLRFSRISKDEEEILINVLNEYIDQFIDGTLQSTQNYLVFEKQKEKFLEYILEKGYLDKYGSCFFIGFERDHFIDFQPLHTMFALERQGLLTIETLGIAEPTNTPPPREFETYHYHAKVLLSPLLLEELSQMKAVSNRQGQNHELSQEDEWKFDHFDEEKGQLFFKNGQCIEISQNGKETDHFLLMKTITRDVHKNWWHEDEILYDWNIGDTSDLPSNKVYQAAKSLQKKIASKTLLKENSFLEIAGKKKFRINRGCL